MRSSSTVRASRGLAALLISSAALAGACSNSAGAPASVKVPSIAATVSLPSAGAASLAIDEQRNRIYVGAVNKIFVFDGSNDTQVAAIDLETGDFGTSPVVDAATNTIYAANSNGSVTVIDGATNAVTKTVSLAPGGNLTQAVLDTTTHKLYATNYQVAILVVDVSTMALTRTIEDADANFVALNQGAGKIYVSDYHAGKVRVLDGATDQIVKTIQVGKAYADDGNGGVVDGSGSGPDGIVVNEATNMVYVANQTDGTFVTIDGSTDTVVKTVPATAGGSGLFWVDVLRKAPYAAYVTNFSDNTLTVLERGGVVAGRVSLGAAANSAAGVAVNSATGKIYVVDFGDPNEADGGYDSMPDSALIVLE